MREGVRWHVQRMRRCRRCARVGACSGKRQARMVRVVERVNHVMDGAWMPRVTTRHVERNGGRARQLALVTGILVEYRDERERVLKRDFIVARPLLMHRGRG